MIIIEGVEYHSHKEYFDKYPWKRAAHKKINRPILLQAYNKPCADCLLLWHPAAMTLDHTERDGYRTSEGIRKHPSQMLAYSPEIFKAEISKCETVCGNCHTLRELVRDGHIAHRHWLPWQDVPLRGALILNRETI